MCHDIDSKLFKQVEGHWKDKNFPVYTFLIEKLWTFLPNRKIEYDLKVCHRYDPGSGVQVQSHC